MQPLTKTQKETLDFLIVFIEKNKYSPSIFEIKKRFKLKSVSSAFFRIEQLVEKNYIKKEKNIARSITINTIIDDKVIKFVKNFNPRIFNHPKRFKDLIKILNEFKEKLNK